MKKNVLYVVCCYDGDKIYNVKPKNIFKEEHEFYDWEVRDSIINTTLPRIKTWCHYYNVELKLITKIPDDISKLCTKITQLYTENSKNTNIVKGFDLKIQKSKHWFIKFYILNEFCKSNYEKFLYIDADAFFDNYKDIFSLFKSGIYFKTKPATVTCPQYRLNKKHLNKIIKFFVVASFFGGTHHTKKYIEGLVNYDNLTSLMEKFGPKIFFNDEVLLTNFFHDYDLLHTLTDEDIGLKFSAGSERIYQYVLKSRELLKILN